MATTFVHIGRQEPQYAVLAVTPADIAAGNTHTVQLPVNALLLDLTVDTTTAFNSGTTATLTAGDGTTTFASAVAISSAGRETVTGIGKFYPTGGTLTVTAAQTGTAATTGVSYVAAKYVIVGREQFTYGGLVGNDQGTSYVT